MRLTDLFNFHWVTFNCQQYRWAHITVEWGRRELNKFTVLGTSAMSVTTAGASIPYHQASLSSLLTHVYIFDSDITDSKLPDSFCK